MREALRVVEDGENGEGGEVDPMAVGPTVILTAVAQIAVAESWLEVSKRYMTSTTGGRSTIEVSVIIDSVARPCLLSVAHMIAWWKP